jgi:hypothetical protein
MTFHFVHRQKFKIKIKSLAEEARIIRAQVKKMGKQWKAIVGPEDDLTLSCQRYRIASAQGVLTDHRIRVVAFEARHTLLAYAFLRGVPYRKVERYSDSTPNLASIARIIESLVWKGAVEREKLHGWIDAALEPSA